MSSVQPVTYGEVGQVGPNIRIGEPIVFAVCQELDVSPILFYSTDRHAPLPLARKLAAWLLYRRGWVAREIAELFGKEVSTVYYYLHNCERRRLQEWEIARLCSVLGRRFPVKVLTA